ncbi:potassium voltage-gated channel [Angomonas deanei]|nr:potassium voltage-gated channel [Angomonas deanei]|eukprot:EPY34953.1 potassium voltage-gated channel [Angomonas deanei]
MTITYGSDGFHLRELTRRIRHDLNGQLSSTFWQCYQTGERAAFFTTTKVANGAADILTTSITQQVITHTEGMGYHLVSSYVTLSPDVVHTSVRMLIHNFIFRRVQLGTLEMGDAEQLMQHGGGEEEELETFVNFEERPVGPQKHLAQPTTPAEGTRSSDIW